MPPVHINNIRKPIIFMYRVLNEKYGHCGHLIRGVGGNQLNTLKWKSGLKRDIFILSVKEIEE